MSRFFKEVRNEMKKVIWPNREELITNTSVVIIVSLVTAVFVGVCGVAPAMMIDDTVYGNLTRERIVEIIKGYKNE